MTGLCTCVELFFGVHMLLRTERPREEWSEKVADVVGSVARARRSQSFDAHGSEESGSTFMYRALSP